MGVDCKILLPAAAQIRDVADVLGALAGFPMHKRHFGPPLDGWIAGRDYRDENVVVKPYSDSSSLIAHMQIVINGESVDGENGHQVMYHFEGSRKGEHLLMPRSTDFWIAIGKGLVDFFGGTVDYNDCDDSDVDYQQPERSDIHAEDGEEWTEFQERKLAVKPLTKEQLAECRKEASYK